MIEKELFYVIDGRVAAAKVCCCSLCDEWEAARGMLSKLIVSDHFSENGKVTPEVLEQEIDSKTVAQCTCLC